MSTNRAKTSPKERILKTGERLFYQQGYLATGVNQIIKEAQVAKASFYQYFPSKEALILECIKDYNAKFFQKIQQLDKQFKESKSKILALFDYAEERAQLAVCGGCVFLNIVAEFSYADSQPRQLIAKFKTDLKLVIERWVLKGADISTQSARAKATTIYLLFEASLIESRVHNDVWPIHASKAAVIQLLN